MDYVLLDKAKDAQIRPYLRRSFSNHKITSRPIQARYKTQVLDGTDSSLVPCLSSSVSFSLRFLSWSKAFSSHFWALRFRSEAPPDMTPDF